MSANDTGNASRRFFAVASLGKGRWYWIVWPSLEELQRSKDPLFHIAEGMEETKADAVEKALDVAGRFATWIAGKYAKTHYQNSRAGVVPGVPALQEFLFRDIYDPANKQWNSVPHRILRKTSNHVYVEQQPHSSGGLTGSWLNGDPPTYRLDRQVLERHGQAFIPAAAELTDQEEPVFFTSARYAWHGSEVPACLKVLGLTWPCTVTEVQNAYRKLVKSAHPDGGGSHDRFLELQTAYEQALSLCR